MPKKGTRKIGNRWFTQEDLLEAGRELVDLFEEPRPLPDPKEGGQS